MNPPQSKCNIGLRILLVHSYSKKLVPVYKLGVSLCKLKFGSMAMIVLKGSDNQLHSFLFSCNFSCRLFS